MGFLGGVQSTCTPSEELVTMYQDEIRKYENLMALEGLVSRCNYSHFRFYFSYIALFSCNLFSCNLLFTHSRNAALGTLLRLRQHYRSIPKADIKGGGTSQRPSRMKSSGYGQVKVDLPDDNQLLRRKLTQTYKSEVQKLLKTTSSLCK